MLDRRASRPPLLFRQTGHKSPCRCGVIALAHRCLLPIAPGSMTSASLSGSATRHEGRPAANLTSASASAQFVPAVGAERVSPSSSRRDTQSCPWHRSRHAGRNGACDAPLRRTLRVPIPSGSVQLVPIFLSETTGRPIAANQLPAPASGRMESRQQAALPGAVRRTPSGQRLPQATEGSNA